MMHLHQFAEPLSGGEPMEKEALAAATGGS